MPIRIQRKRTKGWKMPPNTKCVTRPGPFGNPFVVDRKFPNMPMSCKTPEEAVAKYTVIVAADAHLRALIRRDLRGFNLACFCKEGAICHADVLLRIANE